METSGDRDTTNIRAWHWVLLLGSGCAVFAMVYFLLPVGVDFYYQFWRIPREWLLEGQKLYNTTYTGLYNPPWTVLLLLPFSLLPIRWGMAALTLFSIAVVLWTVRVFSPPQVRGPLLPILALCNLYTFDLLQRGQIDGFALLGLSLAFWATSRQRPWLLSLALVLLSVKPINFLLPALVVLWPVHRWAPRDLTKVLALPLLVLASSFLLFGWDWPVWWWASYQAVPPQEAWMSGLWRAQHALGLPLWIAVILSILAVAYFAWKAKQTGPGRRLVAVAQIVNLLITPYALAYHYVAILAVSLPEIMARSRAAALVLWSLTFLPLLRLWLPPAWWSLDALFPLAALALFAALDFRSWQTRGSAPDRPSSRRYSH